MHESFRGPSCVNSRLNRKSRFAIVHAVLSLTMCLCLACATRQEASVRCPAIEMSAVTDTPDSGKTVALNDTTTILVSRTPLVATSDITGATASEAGGEWTLNFTVTDDAAKRVHDFTQQHVGGTLAIVVDGKVRGMPQIGSAIVGNRYRISELNRTDAERMATAISAGCRR